MRVIKITDNFISFADAFYKELFCSMRKDCTPVRGIDKIKEYCPADSWEYNFFDQISSNPLQKLFLLTPSEIDDIANKARPYLHLFYDENKMKDGKKAKDKKTDLGKFILDKLRYTDFRSNAYKIIEYLGINTCLYCNTNLTVSYIDSKGKKKVRLELDHYFPKDKFPFLSICFFNLIPSCHACNRLKRDTVPDFNNEFHPYDSFKGLDPFYFKLNDSSVIDYLLSQNKEEIKFEFQATQNSDPKFQNMAKIHSDKFGIQPIYETQKDVLEEMILKSKIYTDNYQKDLLERFDYLFYDQSIIKRMVVGNYVEEEYTHKRPMAKFQRDIAEQLGLI